MKKLKNPPGIGINTKSPELISLYPAGTSSPA
jgi:hypothetical protein